jgi:hypothetical protein
MMQLTKRKMNIKFWNLGRFGAPFFYVVYLAKMCLNGESAIATYDKKKGIRWQDGNNFGEKSGFLCRE